MSPMCHKIYLAYVKGAFDTICTLRASRAESHGRPRYPACHLMSCACIAYLKGASDAFTLRMLRVRWTHCVC